MSEHIQQEIQLVYLDRIRVLNPRMRNQRKFEQIVESIATLGLKKPITVSRRREEPDCADYDLVCGQGRLEAFKVLGWKDIPARVIDVSKEDRLVMSLVENLARKNPDHIELLQNVQILKDRGYTLGEIAQKTGLTTEYISGIIRLLEQGEERLIQAVERYQIPLSIALDIAKAEKEDTRRVLMEAYESNKLKGRAIQRARRLVEQREAFGKAFRRGCPRSIYKKPSSADALVKAYKEETEKQQQMVKKAKLCETRLVFIIEGLKELMRDENFVNLLRAERLEIMPKYLKDQIK